MKKSLTLLIGVVGIASSVAFAGPAKAPHCPSVSDVQSVQYLDTYQKLDGTFAAVGASDFGKGTPWAVVQLGLKHDNPREANRKASHIDTQKADVASSETLFGLPYWGCVYTSSTDQNLKVVALTAMDSLGLLTGPAKPMNSAALVSQVK